MVLGHLNKVHLVLPVLAILSTSNNIFSTVTSSKVCCRLAFMLSSLLQDADDHGHLVGGWQITKVVPANTIGTVMGVTSSVETLARVLSPLIGGVVLASHGPQGVGALAFICLLPVIAYQAWVLVRKSRMPLPPVDDIKKEL